MAHSSRRSVVAPLAALVVLALFIPFVTRAAGAGPTPVQTDPCAGSDNPVYCKQLQTWKVNWNPSKPIPVVASAQAPTSQSQTDQLKEYVFYTTGSNTGGVATNGLFGPSEGKNRFMIADEYQNAIEAGLPAAEVKARFDAVTAGPQPAVALPITLQETPVATPASSLAQDFELQGMNFFGVTQPTRVTSQPAPASSDYELQGMNFFGVTQPTRSSKSVAPATQPQRVELPTGDSSTMNPLTPTEYHSVGGNCASENGSYDSMMTCMRDTVNTLQGGITKDDVLKIQDYVQAQSDPTPVSAENQALCPSGDARCIAEQTTMQENESFNAYPSEAATRAAATRELLERAQSIEPSRPCAYGDGGCAPEAVAIQTFKGLCDAQSTKPFLFFFSRVDTEASANCVQNLQRQAGFLNDEQTGVMVEERTTLFPTPPPVTGGFTDRYGNRVADTVTQENQQSPSCHTGLLSFLNKWNGCDRGSAAPAPSAPTVKSEYVPFVKPNSVCANEDCSILTEEPDNGGDNDVNALLYEPLTPAVEPATVDSNDYEWTSFDWEDWYNNPQNEMPNYQIRIQPDDYGDGGYIGDLFPDLFNYSEPTRQFSQAEPSPQSMQNQSLAASALSALIPTFIETGI